ncbi:MAG: S-layer homology domain-containing protein [Sporomusaceae bacterium]|jgi:hypothetical protein|nr:S-layer homology domain-containing protein [Sporomusaceae bacterium]
MKKHLSLALAAVFSLSVAGVALAAPANPFVDVPANHWAYDAVAELQQSGIVGGYGDGTFRGDRTLTRYELAAIVAKIDYNTGKDNPLVKKLQAEFATELYNLGVRIDALEKNASSIKFSGDGRLRYVSNQAYGVAAFDNDNNTTEGFENRIQLHLEAAVNDKITFYGRMLAEHYTANREDPSSGTRTSSSSEFAFDRAEFKWENAGTSISVGRLVPTLGQGIIWDDTSADGVMISKDFGRFELGAGYLDFAATTDHPIPFDPPNSTIGAFVANLGIKVTDNINLTAAYLDSRNKTDYNFEQMAFGFDAGLGNDFTLIGEYVQNRAADENKKGGWGRLQWKEADPAEPGTYAVYVDYLKLGGWAIDSDTFGHVLNVAGGNGPGGDGAKGYGLGFQYVPAKNMDIEANIYDLKTYDGGQKYKKSYTLATNFYF